MIDSSAMFIKTIEFVVNKLLIMKDNTNKKHLTAKWKIYYMQLSNFYTITGFVIFFQWILEYCIRLIHSKMYNFPTNHFTHILYNMMIYIDTLVMLIYFLKIISNLCIFVFVDLTLNNPQFFCLYNLWAMIIPWGHVNLFVRWSITKGYCYPVIYTFYFV